MDAMILAAGLGTRLRPRTDHTPKALIQIGGITMLERIARQLVEAGADRIIVNVHHHAEQIERFVLERLRIEAEIFLSWERERPLETGGGLQHAEKLFRRDAPFFLHNVDVIAHMDLGAMYGSHIRSGALVTLAVNQRDTSRLLLFDERGLCGWANVATGEAREARTPAGSPRSFGFAGVHVASPEIFRLMEERGAFSIIALYTRLAGAGHVIRPYDMSDAQWWEVGSEERLKAARAALESPR